MNTKHTSSSREQIKKNTNNIRKFHFNNGKIYNDKKKKKNPIEVKKTDMEELKKNGNKQNDVNVYIQKSNNKICIICGENLKPSEVRRNKLKCKHLACTDCYYEYIKEKINSNKFLDIKCPQEDCQQIIQYNMIVQILVNDKALLEKYNKLIKRNQLMLDPNIQLCPYPDCESYAKKTKNKYVKCIEKKHKFCFICLKDWHGKIPCKDSTLTNSLNVLEKNNQVKRCPKCKFFIEKGEGCNHMTCSNCGYQFCWLCLGEYNINHFEYGRCRGRQYSREPLTRCGVFCQDYVLRFLFLSLKAILFGLISPFVLIARIYYIIYDDCINGRNNFFCFLYVASGVIACFTFYPALQIISNFIGLLMFFIWPLNDKIFYLIDRIF